MTARKRLGSYGSEFVFNHQYYSAEFWKSLSSEQLSEQLFKALAIYDAHRAEIKRRNQNYYGKGHTFSEESIKTDEDSEDSEDVIDDE